MSLAAQMVKNLPAMQETILGQEDPEEKGMATHSSIIAWRTPWTEEPDRLQSMALQTSQTSIQDTITFLFFPTFNSLPVFDLRKCQEQNTQSEEKGKEHTYNDHWSAL